MVEAGRAHWRPSSPTPLLKQGNLESAAWDYNQVAFYYLQGERHGQPVPVLSHPQRKCFLMFSLFQCVSIASDLVTECHWKQPGSVFALSFQLFVYTEDPP